LAVEEEVHSGVELARFAGINRMGVRKAVIRGMKFERIKVPLLSAGFFPFEL
jgi:hypothetical protein